MFAQAPIEKALSTISRGVKGSGEKLFAENFSKRTEVSRP